MTDLETTPANLSRAYDSVDLRVWMAVENINQREAARLFGVSSQTVSNWCNGKHPINLRERMEAAIAALADQHSGEREDA